MVVSAGSKSKRDLREGCLKFCMLCAIRKQDPLHVIMADNKQPCICSDDGLPQL